MRALTLAFVSLAVLAAAPSSAKSPAPVPVALPGGGEGVGFDDLTFDPASRKVLVPGGRTGKVFLFDPATRTAAALGGFHAQADYRGGHGEGVTTADAGAGVVFAADRDEGLVKAVDPASGKAVASAKLAATPDYVRFVAATGEVWVSEPGAERIEVFAFSRGKDGAALTRAASIPVPGGPESLVVDGTRGRAYTHAWKGETIAVGLKSRAVEARWKNGCSSSRGIALDPETGFVFAGCEEGKAVVLDAAKDGRELARLEPGKGVDVIAFDAARRRLFVPGAGSATMAVLAVSRDGRLSLERTVKTVPGAHCVIADDRGAAWVCDPDRGRLLVFPDAPGRPR